LSLLRVLGEGYRLACLYKCQVWIKYLLRKSRYHSY
jgi:hypothetical protein